MQLENCETNCQVVRAKHVASALHHMMSGSFSRELEVTTVLIERLGCLVGSVWGNQHLCMQRQHSSQATSTLGNTPNLHIGSFSRKTLHRYLRRETLYWFPDKDSFFTIVTTPRTRTCVHKFLTNLKPYLGPADKNVGSFSLSFHALQS